MPPPDGSADDEEARVRRACRGTDDREEREFGAVTRDPYTRHETRDLRSIETDTEQQGQRLDVRDTGTNGGNGGPLRRQMGEVTPKVDIQGGRRQEQLIEVEGSIGIEIRVPENEKRCLGCGSTDAQADQGLHTGRPKAETRGEII
jgi:hypothetical protein